AGPPRAAPCDAPRLGRDRGRAAVARAALDRAGRECGRPPALLLLLKQRIELAARVERLQLVRAADMDIADEDLRHCLPAGALDELHPRVVVPADVDLFVLHVLLLQQALRADAVGAGFRGVDLDRFHVW